MSYSIEQKEDMFCLYDNDTGKKIGEYRLRREAVAKMQELQRKPKTDDSEESDKKKAKKSDDDEGDHEYRD